MSRLQRHNVAFTERLNLWVKLSNRFVPSTTLVGSYVSALSFSLSSRGLIPFASGLLELT